MMLTEPKFLQSQVNKLSKKALKLSLNPLDENDSDEEGQEKDEHTVMMEDGGFTVVALEKEGAAKSKGSDGHTTVQGVT